MYHLIFVVKIKNNMKVCILGNSLSSLALAKALVNQKIYVDIFIRKKGKKINHTRTLGISKSNIDFFIEHIIDVKKITWKIRKIEIFTDNLKKEKLINFENNNKELFSIIKNYKLFELLEKNISSSKYLKKIHKNNPLPYLNDYDLVINTDNLNQINNKFFNKKIIKKYNSIAHTTIIKHKNISNDIATQIFTKYGPIAFLPISNSETSIVYSIHNSQNKFNINDLIRKYNFQYEIKKIEKIESVELKSFSLRSYYHSNILAFGDLLHRIHPLAGQGFNMTIRDIKILLDIIKERLNLGLPLDSTICLQFEKKLKHKNYIFSNGIDLIHELFNFERKLKSNILSKSIKILSNNSSINKFFTNVADRGILF